MPGNNARRWAAVSAVITVAGAVMMAAGIILDSYDFYWMILVGLLLVLAFLICFFIFLGQARRLGRMFRGEELLAHWIFGSEEQDRKAEAEFREKKVMHRILLGIIAFFFVLFGVLFAVFGFDEPEDALGFLAAMAGIFALIATVALITPYTSYKRMRKSVPEVYLGLYSAWVMGEYTQWKAPMTRITGVSLKNGDAGIVIEVGYSILQRYGWQPHECRIPVPDGKEGEARDAAVRLASSNEVGFTDLVL